jgi:peptide/nickel transport system ATP-binding protein
MCSTRAWRIEGTAMSSPVLSVTDLAVTFSTREGAITAVNSVTLQVATGEVLGLVGESGSGKSVTGLAIMGLIDAPGRIAAGSIKLAGRELVGLPEKEMRRIRGKEIAMIFQDPMTTLNPVLRIDTQMIEAIQAHENVSDKAALARARDALVRVGIPSPDERLNAYPHQFSGGMRQRVAIAIALLNRPLVLVADEPTTALDVTIQAQILAEVQALAAESGTAMIWITHDLSVVAGLADRVAVMYAGRIVEEGSVSQVLEQPLHPYTHGLMCSIPSCNPRGCHLPQIPGMTPSLARLPEGCAFRPRCSRATDICRTEPPAADFGMSRMARCFHPRVDTETAA